ncbi:hypothetical protein AB0L00_08570 [Actinoallomurus sp. NPDC052308]|uniref:hypothetical protein n=1 Tax=Actinoallomurus sp. NPDC052308 TaxID=3155530 RepID=UPI00341C0914
MRDQQKGNFAMKPENRKDSSSLPGGRDRSLSGWLIHHPRRAARWLLGLAGRSVWLTAGVALIGNTVAARVSGAVLQPLTAGHQLTALQANAVLCLFTLPLYGIVMAAGRRKLNEPRLRDAVPDTERRDRVFPWVLSAVRKFTLVHALLSRIVEREKRHRWVLSFLPYLATGFGASVLGQFYAARMPLATGVAIVTLGPAILAMALAWKGDKKGLPLFLPLLSASGAMMFIPWGEHVDGAGLLAAVAGAVLAAVGVSARKSVSDAGMLAKTGALLLTVNLALGVPSLLMIHWTWGILLRGIASGVFNTGGFLLFWIAHVPLHCPKRLAAAVAVTLPALSALVGFVILHQTLGPVGLVGVFVALVGFFLNTTLTGSADELAAEKANSHTNRAAALMANAHSGESNTGPGRRPRSGSVANERPGRSGRMRRRRTSARWSKD